MFYRKRIKKLEEQIELLKLEVRDDYSRRFYLSRKDVNTRLGDLEAEVFVNHASRFSVGDYCKRPINYKKSLKERMSLIEEHLNVELKYGKKTEDKLVKKK